MNVDAGCFNNGKTYWGMLIRDDRGLPLFAASKSEEIQISPTLAEAMGLRWHLNLAKENRYENLLIELDAEVVVKCLSGRLKLAEIENVILDCSNLLSSLCNTRVSHIGRAKNMEAHSLVGVARNVGSKSWVGNVPNPTASIVRSEAFFI
ncbi:hypothetical protein QL285_074547 [Trifolium repens]|jgi:ribonuclease HI|nr:hypothetical protein QL285_074547 [Trifolium repens]